MGRLPLSQKQDPASALVLGAGGSGMALSTAFDLFEWAFPPLVLFAVAAWLLMAARKPFGPGDARGLRQKSAAKPRAPSTMPRSLPPPSSPDSIYLQMRLRLAKKSAEEEAKMGTCFVVRFSSQDDSICENPVSGGTFRLRAGVPHVLEFDSLAACSSLTDALQRSSQQVEYQVYYGRRNRRES